ncbi:hypothetical protein ACHAXM_003182 [Skeletonema potamos]
MIISSVVALASSLSPFKSSFFSSCTSLSLLLSSSLIISASSCRVNNGIGIVPAADLHFFQSWVVPVELICSLVLLMTMTMTFFGCCRWRIFYW